MADTAINANYAGVGYVRRGWSVIPIEAFGTRPLCDWEEFRHRIADCEEIDDWDWHYPNANVGLVTGALSRLVVVETDPTLGGGGRLARLEKIYGLRTVEALTAAGGRQLYFAHPGGVLVSRELAPGVKLIGDGGYVVAPPSMDATGARCTWLPGSGPDERALAPLPGWLLALAQHQPNAPPEHWAGWRPAPTSP